jgi:hypothetical protein
LRPDGLLRGACHRVRIRATRWHSNDGEHVARMERSEMGYQACGSRARSLKRFSDIGFIRVLSP